MNAPLHARYDNNGIRFSYPENWELQEETASGGTMISINSPGTSFWSVTLEFEGPDPKHVLQQAVEVFRDEYSELDVYPVETTISHRAAVGRDIEFVCLDLLNTACLRAFRTGRFTALVLYQGTDEEFEDTRDVLEAITASLECEGDELLFGEA